MPESDYQIPVQTSGASAAATIFSDSLASPLELNAVTATSTANTSSAVAVDVLKNGTTVFGNSGLGTIFQGTTAQGTSGGITSTSQTTFDFAPSGKPIEKNSVILVESEQMLVTDVQGSATQSPTGTGVQRLTVTRGYNGTTAATHAAGVAVGTAKPTIPNAAQATPSGVQLPVPIAFAAGDTLAVVGATGATNLGVVLNVIDV